MTEARAPFHHVAYEAYEDILVAARRLVPLVGVDDARVGSQWLALHRTAFARHYAPFAVAADETERVVSALPPGRTGTVPPTVPFRRWRGVLRKVESIKQLVALKAPTMLIEFSREQLAEEVEGGLQFQDYHPPVGTEWTNAASFVAHIVEVAATSLDDAGIGDEVNAATEVKTFLNENPSAYTFWDIHGTAEDYDSPEPFRYPAELWLARSVTLTQVFLDRDGRPVGCGQEGFASFNAVADPLPAALHPKLAASCRDAAKRGLALVGYVAVRP